MSRYDRWLCDGPTVNCDGCGRSLGRLHDGRGEQPDGSRFCGECEVEAQEARLEADSAAQAFHALQERRQEARAEQRLTDRRQR